MRIITGKYRGRKLETPFGNEIRPTSNKVKESIFNILMCDIEDAVCVDLFAGTGNLGLEALSRGASKCWFCDNERNSVDIIKRNIKYCKAENESIVLAGDYNKALKRIDEKVDIVFLDPPYHDGLYEKAIEQIDMLDLLTDVGIIVAEHEKMTDLPEHIGGLKLFKHKKYGKICLSLYKRADSDDFFDDEEKISD